MPKVIWTPHALADMERLFSFLTLKNPSAANKAASLIRKAGDELETTPYIGVAMPDETGRREHFKPFGSGAYVLRYMIDGDCAVILRVWHSREARED